MLIELSQLRLAYNQIRDRARADQTAVLILVTRECDAIAASHTFTSFLRSDNIAFSLHPVNNYQDVFDRLQSRDPSSYRSVVLFNCGANINLEVRLGWSEEQWEECQLFVFDSHRPIHYNNVHFDRNPVQDQYGISYFADDLKDAKVVIIDCEEQKDKSIPSLDVVSLYEDDFDDYDDDGSMPAHRRRVGDTDDSTSVHDEDVIQKEKESLAKKRIANLKIEQYGSRSYRSQPSAMLMFTLATELRKDTNEALWWSIIGLTDQFVNSLISQAEYESWLRVMAPEVSRMNPDEGGQAANIGRIQMVNDLKFMLYRYWTLYDSMYHCEYIAVNLQLWKDRKNDSNQLRTLLAKMGVARTEAEQKYLSMKASIQGDLKKRLKKQKVNFRIENYKFPTFHKIRHLAHYISAADCVNITTAMLNHPSSPTEKWEDWFYKAYDF